MLGAPAGASTPFGKSGTDPFKVRSIVPLKGGSGLGNTMSVAASAERGSAVDASADAAKADVELRSRRRLISILPTDGALDFLFASLILRPPLRRQPREKEDHARGL